MTFRARVVRTRFLVGCASGVSGPTAIVDLVLDGDVPAAAPEQRLRNLALGLHVKQTLNPVANRDSPDTFLLPHSPVGADDPAPAWVGRWAVALTVAIQRFGFDPVYNGVVVHAEPGRLQVALGWRRAHFFNESLELALRIIDAATVDSPLRQQDWGRRSEFLPPPPLTVTGYFGDRWAELQSGGLPQYTATFAEAAALRGMPLTVNPYFILVGWGAGAERLDMTCTGRTPWIAAALAKMKNTATRAFEDAHLPTPQSRPVTSLDEARKAAADFGWPVVVKPPNLDMGSGVVSDIRGPESLARAYECAVELSSDPVLVERHEPGYCYRLLVVHGRVIAVARRMPPEVTGDGRRTIAELVDAANADPRRHTVLRQIVLDDDARDYLSEQGLDPQAVPEADRLVPLRRTAYVFSGGLHQNVAGIAHPDNLALAVRAARVAGLDIAGVDFVTADISRSWRTGCGVICEINAQPALSPHWVAEPDRDISGEILDILFEGRSARIPTTAAIGADAGAVTRLIHRIFTGAGMLTGLCSREGIWIGADDVTTGDERRMAGVQTVLIDPGVQAAVVELSPAQLANEGHPCDRYDVSVLVGVRASDDAAAELVARTAVAVVRPADERAPGGVLIEPRGSEVAAGLVAVEGGRVVVRADAGSHDIAAWSGRREVLYAAAAAWAHGIDVGVIARTLQVTDAPAGRSDRPA